VADRIHKPALTRHARNLTMQIGMLIAINLFIGFTIANIDNAAHIGGLLAGAVLGFLVVPKGARLDSFWSRPGSDAGHSGGVLSIADRTRLLRVAGVLAVASVIALVVALSPLTYDVPMSWLLAR
jgi:hypothetical protein